MAKFPKLGDTLKCNSPRATPDHPEKKMVVKGCEDGKEKLVRFGAKGYKSNYSKEARKNFRARHNCDTATDKTTARHWACKALW